MKIIRKAGFLILLSLMGLVFCWPTGNLLAENRDYAGRLYYLYEVGNSIPLSDFELGSTESIKDEDGNGGGLAFVVRKGKNLTLELDLGYSRTIYKGSVEDGVSVTFEPQAGSGYDVLSSSKNVTYEFDVTFENPYVGLNLLLFDWLRIGGGRLFQRSQGSVVLSSESIELITASFEARTQLYYQVGAELDLEGIFFSALLRSFEAPALIIESCNEKALGELNCSRIEGAANNLNLKTNNFGGGVLQLGWKF